MTNDIRELNLNELETVSGGMDPLHLLAQVNHLQADNASDAVPVRWPVSSAAPGRRNHRAGLPEDGARHMINNIRELNLIELETISGGSNVALANRLTAALAADTASDTLSGVLGGAGSKKGSPRKTA